MTNLTDEDIDWIEQDLLNNKEKLMEPTYNKVQYSEFTPDRVGQWVLRGDTIEEVLSLKEKLFGMAKPAVIAQPAPVVAAVTHPNQDGVTNSCKECGAPAQWREGVGKSTGKPWKGWFCTASRDHKPFFIK